jgi:type VI secretion system secreted protein VgrG
LTRLADGQVWHYVTDHLGTPQEMYDQDGEIVWAADFSAYGLTARSLALEVDNPIRFPGQYYDAESNLHYNRFRYYDPQVGRYINQDPIGLFGGDNPYEYALNMPTQAYDPMGLFVPLVILAGLGAKALVGAGVEVGMQSGKQMLFQMWDNWEEGQPITAIKWKCIKMNWSQVGMSAAFSAIAPGLGGTKRTVSKSLRSIKALSGQSAKTEGRANKLMARKAAHKNSIKDALTTQAAWQAGKVAAKCVVAGHKDDCEE